MAETRPSVGGRLRVFNGGFFDRRVSRILMLAGLRPTFGLPRGEDRIGVWGRSPTAWRGERIGEATGAPLVRVEDAFLRSVHPGRRGDPPLGLLVDRCGVHFDSSAPSDLEILLSTCPLSEPALLSRAEAAVDWMRRSHLTKYACVLPDLPKPDPGYVLVVDQTCGDASIRHGRASAATFREMLKAARSEHPDRRIVIKTHPETAAGHRTGHFSGVDVDHRTMLLADPLSPWTLIDGAAAIYAVSSQIGFEAILAGRRPRVFGQPFYSGWGLSDDVRPVPRRTRILTRAQLAAGALLLYPTWFDPYRDRLCEIEDVLASLEAQARAWREDRTGWVAVGMRAWKRRPLQRMFGRERPVIFENDPLRATARAERRGARLMVWSGRDTFDVDAPPRVRVEDGFLRSRGLGADLVAPLSLVCDRTGIYYDPSRPSDLEDLIARSCDLPAEALARAERLIAAIRTGAVTKYNLGASDLPRLPDGYRILVPGQVEDDASVRLGSGEIADNAALLAPVRAVHPHAVIVYKPHPDVEAGLRPGAIAAKDADIVLRRTNPAAILAQIDAVWTMTSAIGFEALLRNVPVTCLGVPFYAGWGLTRDLATIPDRRRARPGLNALVHAVLIDYPRYFDPVTRLPCPPEIVLERLAANFIPQASAANRLLARAQGALSGHAHLWR